MRKRFLAIGLAGKTLSPLEREILRDHTPYSVVLFGRNIASVEQLKDLVHEVKVVASHPPLFMIDEEGGRVDRLRHLVPGLPGAEGFGEGERPEEMSEWFGRVIGMALRYFDVEIDLAPVVDVRGEQSAKGLERRTFGREPETIITLAGAFMRGLHSQGVASCLKHWPGIGCGSADPHYGATVIDAPLDNLMRSDFVPFKELGHEAGAIMIGHGTYPQIDDPDLPASLSRRLTAELLHEIGFDGLAISDDMEMHAVSDLGSYEEISEKALLAGNDVILFCSHIERVPDIQKYLQRRVGEDAGLRQRFEEAISRSQRYRQWCARLRSDAAPGPATLEELLEETERFCTAFQETRPPGQPYIPAVDRRKAPRSPGSGRSGREEWT
jgi:beta-N-acetylhexosaminidase